MIKCKCFHVGGLVLFAVFLQLIFPSQSRSQVMSEGVSVVVISEHNVNTAGMEKVKLIRMTLQPGASIENLPVANTAL